MLSLTEQQLLPDVTQARTGDLAAFERLILRCRHTVTGIALAIVKDLDASEEVAQQVFIHVWQQLNTLREPASFLPWVRQITRYRAFNYLRDHKIAQKVQGDEADMLLEQFADPSANVAENLQRDQQNRLIQQLVEQLPEDSREIVLLYYREEQSSQQVAELLGLSDANVRKKLSRVRELLKEQLLSRYGKLLLSTAPGIGFSSLIAAVLVSTGPPAAAAAATALTASTGSSSGGSLLAKLSLLLGGAMLGALAGVAGIFYGMKQVLKQVNAPQERQALLRLRNLTIGWALGSGVLLTLSYELTPGAWAPLSSYLLFIVGISLSMWRVQQIVRPRLAAAAAADPAEAQRQRRQKIGCAVGTLLGAVTGAAGMIVGLINNGRW